MKFKYNTLVKVINDPFFEGATGNVISWKRNGMRAAYEYLIMFSGREQWINEKDLMPAPIYIEMGVKYASG